MNHLAAAAKPDRYQSLDVLRGMTIALMVIVNNPGTWEAIYSPLEHAPWHGFTITDMVFPSFLFVVGNAMSFSTRKFQHQHEAAFLKKVMIRVLLIFFIGLLLNAFPFVKYSDAGTLTLKNFTAIRVFGVLQRIALCYGMASIAVYYLNTRSAIVLSAVILTAYWGIMYFFGDPADRYSLEGNAALRLDLYIIGPANMYKGEGMPFDPEGILSTLPAIVNVIGGYLAAQYIQKHGNTTDTVRRLIYIGIVLVILALCWNFVFPINKKIWTSSYVLLTIGLNMIAIALLMLIIEIANRRKWTYFFEVFGKNPLALFVLSGLVVKIMALIRIQGTSMQPWAFRTFFEPLTTPKSASLLYAIFFMVLIWVVGYALDRKKIYIKV